MVNRFGPAPEPMGCAAGLQRAIFGQIQADRDAAAQVIRIRRGTDGVDGTAITREFHPPVT
jgi:hypothetical protein